MKGNAPDLDPRDSRATVPVAQTGARPSRLQTPLITTNASETLALQSRLHSFARRVPTPEKSLLKLFEEFG